MNQEIRDYSWVRSQHVWGGISFATGIGLREQVNIYEYLTSLNRWSVIGQFAFGEYKGPLASQATGTEVFVQEGWHQFSQPHFTVQLRFTYGDTGRTSVIACAHVYLDHSESFDSLDEPVRYAKSAEEKSYQSWNKFGPWPQSVHRPPCYREWRDANFGAEDD